MHTAALDNRVPDFRFSFFINFFHAKKTLFHASYVSRTRFSGSWPLFNCCTTPPTHISLYFPVLQACKIIPTMILPLAIEQVTVSIKGHNVMLCSTLTPWISTLSSLVCSPVHFSVRCLHFALHRFHVIPWCLSRHRPCRCMVPVPLYTQVLLCSYQHTPKTIVTGMCMLSSALVSCLANVGT